MPSRVHDSLTFTYQKGPVYWAFSIYSISTTHAMRMRKDEARPMIWKKKTSFDTIGAGLANRT